MEVVVRDHAAHVEVRTVDEPFVVPSLCEVFTDWSHKAGKSAAGIAAGAAAYLIEGTPANGTYRAVGLPVDSHLPQSSYTGEAIGLLLATGLTPPEVQALNVVTDSAALIGGWQRVVACGTSFKCRWDGLWRQHLRQFMPHLGTRHISLIKVKSHQDPRLLRECGDEELVRRACGNAAVDGAANHVVDFYLLPGAGERQAKHRAAEKKRFRQAVRSLATHQTLAPWTETKNKNLRTGGAARTTRAE
jgi:hypothetical protein